MDLGRAYPSNKRFNPARQVFSSKGGKSRRCLSALSLPQRMPVSSIQCRISSKSGSLSPKRFCTASLSSTPNTSVTEKRLLFSAKNEMEVMLKCQKLKYVDSVDF